MSEPDDDEWTARSTRIDDFRCDTVFAVRTAVEFCDEATGHIIQGATVTLPVPGLPLVEPEYATALDLLDRRETLARHYRRVVDAHAARGRLRQLAGGSPQFWLRPAIIARGTVVSSFLWYDTVPEAAALLQALVDAVGAADEEVWDDLDQGWRVRILRRGDLVHLAEWNWEDADEVPSGFAFDAAVLAREAGTALDRLRALHRFLVGELGRDYWSRGGL